MMKLVRKSKESKQVGSTRKKETSTRKKWLFAVRDSTRTKIQSLYQVEVQVQPCKQKGIKI